MKFLEKIWIVNPPNLIKLKKNKNQNKNQILDLINIIIENKLFKPISITILSVFLLFKFYQYSLLFFDTSNFFSGNKNLSKSIKISLAGSQYNFDYDEEQILDYEIKNGDTLLKILANIGSNEQDTFAILTAIKKIYNIQNLNTGTVINMTYRAEKKKNRISWMKKKLSFPI